MKAFKSLRYILLSIAAFCYFAGAYSKEYIVYNISQELPMGNKGEEIKKNYYINIGSNQGLRDGTILNVLRTISRTNPYKAKERYNYKVKIAEVKVIHVGEDSSIGGMLAMENSKDIPLFDINSVMIGDSVSIKVK